MLSYFKKALAKTIQGFGDKIPPKINKEIHKDLLEELLIASDIEYEIVEEILHYLPPGELTQRADLERVMGSYFLYSHDIKAAQKPQVIMILGVNGVGKTTSIGKLSYMLKTQGKSVLLGACDTFRAGAISQLKHWAALNEMEITSSAQGHDPSAVAFDAINRARARANDVVILDTAGRLENKKNLAAELEKIVRISSRAKENAPDLKLLVLDATQGRAGIAQAKAFNDLVKLDGVIITKLDGTSKGGALFGIGRELELPILYFGFGEKREDFSAFNPNSYLKVLLDGLFGSLNGQD